jgi:hypothetical protein
MRVTATTSGMSAVNWRAIQTEQSEAEETSKSRSQFLVDVKHTQKKKGKN